MEQTIATIAAFVLSIGGIGAIVMKVAGKVDKYTFALEQLTEAINETVTALKDGQLSAEEVKSITKEFKEAVTSVKAIFKK